MEDGSVHGWQHNMARIATKNFLAFRHILTTSCQSSAHNGSDTMSLRPVEQFLHALRDCCDLKLAQQAVSNQPAVASKMHGQSINQTHALSWTNDSAAAHAEGVLAQGMSHFRDAEHQLVRSLSFTRH